MTCLAQTIVDVARPVQVQPSARAAGLHCATHDDVAYLWREAQTFFERAESAGSDPGAERLRHLGTKFALMAVALLEEMTRAARALRS